MNEKREFSHCILKLAKYILEKHFIDLNKVFFITYHSNCLKILYKN